MIDTKLLEAWCHWIEVEKAADEDRKLMAADIRAFLKELKYSRETVEIVEANREVMMKLIKENERLTDHSEVCRGVVEAARRLCASYPSSTPADFADLCLAIRELDAK